MFVASMTEQGKFFKKGNCDVRFIWLMSWQLLRERIFDICLFSGVAGREEFES